MFVRISLDSNCLNIEHNDPILNKLEKLGDQGKIEFYASGSVRREQKEHALPNNKIKLYNERLVKTKNSSETMIFPARLDEYGTRFVTEESRQKIDQIMKILFPNKEWSELNIKDANDIRILEAHAYACLDYFLTKDNHFLKRKKELEAIGIIIREPNDAFMKELEMIL